MNSKEQEPIRLAASTKTFGFVPHETVFSKLRRINDQLGVELGLEINPHRFATLPGMKRLSQEYGIKIVGIHGPLQPDASIYLREILRNVTKKPADYREALLVMVWLVGFGPLHEPHWLKRYESHFKLGPSPKGLFSHARRTLASHGK